MSLRQRLMTLALFLLAGAAFILPLIRYVMAKNQSGGGMRIMPAWQPG